MAQYVQHHRLNAALYYQLNTIFPAVSDHLIKQYQNVISPETYNRTNIMFISKTL